MESVVIIGGGISGLTAAHELARRGYDVEVVESQFAAGGKARSGRTAEGWPTEHGFRLYPHWYNHLFSIMEQIDAPDGRPVREHLVPVTELRMGSISFGRNSSLTEQLAFTDAFLDALLISEERARSTYRGKTWAQMVDEDLLVGVTGPIRALLADSPRLLVAAKGPQACGITSRSLGARFAAQPGASVLDGPTSEVWIDPWVDQLRQAGVSFRFHTRCVGITNEGERLNVELETLQGRTSIRTSNAIVALPLEVLRRLAPAFLLPDTELASLETAWMSGAQFFLDSPISQFPNGHYAFERSPWALSAVQHTDSWSPDTLQGIIGVAGVLSVILSDADTPGILYDRPARHCTPSQVRDELQAQMAGFAGSQALSRSIREMKVIGWSLDESLELTGDHLSSNRQPLFINTVNSYNLRPPTETAWPNTFLAGDVVRTSTNVATMEAAVESGRRAVNAILDSLGSSAERCKIHDDDSAVGPVTLRLYRKLDRHFHRTGRVAPMAMLSPDTAKTLRRHLVSSAEHTLHGETVPWLSPLTIARCIWEIAPHLLSQPHQI